VSDDRRKARESLYDLIAEESWISHGCNDPKLLAEHHSVTDTLTGERKELCEAIYDLAAAGKPLTSESLRLHGSSDELRGLFDKLAGAIPGSAPDSVMDVLRDTAARREIASASADAFSKATEGADKAIIPIESLEVATSQARLHLQGHLTSGGVSHVGELHELIHEIQWRVQNPGAIKGMPFGYFQIEKFLDGLQGSKLYLVGARPGVGKTGFAGQLAVDLVSQGVGCMFFSCEMSKTQLQQRLLATHCGVNPTTSLQGALVKRDLEAIRKGLKAMKSWPLWIDDTDRINVELLRSRARRAVSKDGVKCIIVDYIQLVRGVEPKSRMSKREEVGEVSGALKALSKELDVPVIALAQLKRTGNAYASASATTELPKPNLESLKESGDLEQDADAVILLHRDQAKSASEASAIIAKNRSGGTGEVNLEFFNDTTSFKEVPKI